MERHTIKIESRAKEEPLDKCQKIEQYIITFTVFTILATCLNIWWGNL